MAFKAEELMIQVLPNQWMWAAGNDPGEGTLPDTACKQNSQKPCCEMNTCRGDTHEASGCQLNSQRWCEKAPPCGQAVTCENDTKKVQGTAGASGLDLLRRQMRERLSQELPF